MATATEHPSKLFGTAGRALNLLENQGVDTPAFLQRIIDNPEFRRQIVELDEMARLGIPDHISQGSINKLLRRVFGELGLSPHEASIYHRYSTPVGIKQLAKTLEQREITVLVLRFGLEDGVPLTLAQVGEAIGRSPERVRQIEARTLYKMRAVETERQINEEVERIKAEGGTPIEGISQGTISRLRRHGIRTIQQLTELTEADLLAIPGISWKTIGEIEDELAKRCRALKSVAKQTMPANKSEALA